MLTELIVALTLTAWQPPAEPTLPPPPPPDAPAPAEATPDQLSRDASIPAEIRAYIKAAQRERVQALSAQRAETVRLERELKMLRLGRLVKRGVQGKYPEPPPPDVRLIEEDDREPRYEFASLAVKTRMIREAMTAMEEAQRAVRLLSDETLLMHPELPAAHQFKDGDFGRITFSQSPAYAAIVRQVIDESNALVAFRAQNPNNLYQTYDLSLVWMEGVDTSEMVDDRTAEIEEYSFIFDGTRIYETVLGGTRTVQVLRVLNVYDHIPRKWFVPAEWR